MVSNTIREQRQAKQEAYLLLARQNVLGEELQVTIWNAEDFDAPSKNHNSCDTQPASDCCTSS